jgi:ribonuclease HII
MHHIHTSRWLHSNVGYGAGRTIKATRRQGFIQTLLARQQWAASNGLQGQSQRAARAKVGAAHAGGGVGDEMRCGKVLS